MAPIGTVQIAGNANAGPSEVELNTLAQRLVARPQDFTNLGSYSTGQSFTLCATGNFTGGAATTLIPTNRIYLTFVLPVDGIIAAVKTVKVSGVQFDTTSRLHTFNLFRATQYQTPCWGVIDVGANAFYQQIISAPGRLLTPSKLRGTCRDSAVEVTIPADPTSANVGGYFVHTASQSFTALGQSFLVDSSYLNTHWGGGGSVSNPQLVNTTDGGGTVLIPISTQTNRTLDPQPLGTVVFPASIVSAGIGNTTILDQRPGEHPVVLSGLCGLELQWTTTVAFASGAASTRFDVGIDILWDELAPNW